MSKLTLRGLTLEPLLDLRQDFDHILGHVFRHHPGFSTESLAMVPPIETWVDEDDKQFHLTMPLPGITPEEVDVYVQGNTLILSGEQAEEPEDSVKMFFEREITMQSFRRSITLPNGSDPEKLTATLDDGILEIVVPIDSSALPKKIAVQSDPKQPKPHRKRRHLRNDMADARRGAFSSRIPTPPHNPTEKARPNKSIDIPNKAHASRSDLKRPLALSGRRCAAISAKNSPLQIQDSVSEPHAGHDQPYFAFRHVSKAFGNALVLDDLNFEVDRGSVVCIQDAKGASKSICHLLMGFIKPDSGRVISAREDITYYSAAQVEHIDRRIVMIFQDGTVFTTCDSDPGGQENLVRVPSHDEMGTSDYADEQSGRLGVGNIHESVCSRNRIGMERSVILANVFAKEPEAVLLDLSAAGLDPVVEGFIRRRKAEGKMTGIAIARDIRFACGIADIADRVLFLHEGRLLPAEPVGGNYGKLAQFTSPATTHRRPSPFALLEGTR